MWEALDQMDKMQTTNSDCETRILCLSLIPILDVVKRRNQNKFYWSAFFNDFFIQLSGRMNKSSKLSLLGPWHVLFFVPKDELETEYAMLQTFVRQFGFWKFFEDNNQILSEDMLPQLKLLPASSAHYLRQFEKEFFDLEAEIETKRLMTLSKTESRRLTV
jgi:hypothetical protein